MTRRALITGMWRRERASVMPVDPARCNEFADRYNAYAQRLLAGVADMGLWRRVVEGWEMLTRG